MKKITFDNHPTLMSFNDPKDYLKALAVELDKYAPENTYHLRSYFTSIFGEYAGLRTNIYRRLKRAYKKYGKRGVVEYLRCLIQKNARTVPINSENGAIELKMVPNNVLDYFTNLIKLVDNWLLPNREN